MRYLVLLFIGIASLGFAQVVWQGRTSTRFLHLVYRTNEDDNRNLDKIDAAIQAITPTTTTIITTTTTAAPTTTTTAAPTTTTAAPTTTTTVTTSTTTTT